LGEEFLSLKDKLMNQIWISRIFNYRKILLGVIAPGIILLSLAGCISARAKSIDPETAIPTPTLNSVFENNEQNYSTDLLFLTTTPGEDLFASTNPTFSTPTANDQMITTELDQGLLMESTPLAPESSDFTVTPSNPVTPAESVLPTPTPDDTATPMATPTPDDLQTVTIYDDNLNKDWYIVNSTGVKYFLHSKNAVHDDTYAIALTPTKDYGNLAFTVKFGSSESYPRDQTLGFRFWLYSGDVTVGTEDLAVSVVGSNDVSYWKWNDKSVTNTVDPVFPETRLYYLGFNDAIPPHTWVQVEVWLDDLKFEPEYKFVTGIYIKNGEGFRDTVYIDQLELVKKPSS
jgi:hypothetical protein